MNEPVTPPTGFAGAAVGAELAAPLFVGVALGAGAGFSSQGNYAVAIGYNAGATSQANNSIAINATTGNLEVATTGFFVAPIRNLQSGNVLQYNATTNEIVYSNILSVSGNITGGNLITAGLITATGNITATANIAGNYFIGNGAFLSGIDATLISNGTSNVKVVSANGNVQINVAGTQQWVFDTTGNITAAGSISTAGNVSAGNINIAQDAIIAGNLTVSGTTSNINVTNLNIQDPIIGIGRGANNAPLTTNDGKDRGEQLWYYSGAEKSAFVGYDNSSGNLVMATDVSITNEVVTFTNYGNVTVGNVSGQFLVASANVTGGNLVTAGLITATGNITSTANVAGGNLVTAGLVTATGNITSTANVAGGNLVTAGLVTAGGNVTICALCRFVSGSVSRRYKCSPRTTCTC